MMNEKFDLLPKHRNGNIGGNGDVFDKTGEHVEKAEGKGTACDSING
jgi:hypothetical protein